MFLAFADLPQVIARATSPVVVVITGECDAAAAVLGEDVQRVLGSRAEVHSMCAALDQIPTIVFYEARDERPILFREGPEALQTLSADLDEAERLARNRPSAEEEATARAEEERSTERMLATEDLSPFPSAFQMARGLARDAWKAARDAASGAPLLLAAEPARVRLDVCAACAFLEHGRCRKCGCVMSVKAQFAAVHCPVGKWPGDDGRV